MKQMLLALFALLSPCAVFATTYVFTASSYNNNVQGSTYTASMHASGTFTTAQPLAANLSNVDITNPASGNSLLDWNFSDGVYTYTPANSSLFDPYPDDNGFRGFVVSTDASGVPTFLETEMASPSLPWTSGQIFNSLFIAAPQLIRANSDMLCPSLSNDICPGVSLGTNSAFAAVTLVTFTVTRQPDAAAVAAPAGNAYGWFGLALVLGVAAWRYLAAAAMSFGRSEFRSKS